jgi:hypothetical protein
MRTAAGVKTKHFDRAWFDVLAIAPTPEERTPSSSASEPTGRSATSGGWNGGSPRDRFEELVAWGRPTALSPFGGWAPAGAVFFEPGVVAEVRYLAGSQLRHATLRSLALDRVPEEDA